MQKYINYRLHINLKYSLIHDLLKKSFKQYMTLPYSKKVQFWGFLGISGNFLGILGPRTGQKSISGQTKENSSKGFPNDTEIQKYWNEPRMGDPGA